MKSVGSIPVDNYITGNLSGYLSNVGQCYNVRREAIIAQDKSDGIEKSEGSIIRMRERIEKIDLDLRKQNDITSVLIPGIIRRCDFIPLLNVYFHSRANLLLISALARGKRLALTIDATGDMWNVPNSSKSGKILHSKITLHPSECVISKSVAIKSHKIYSTRSLSQRGFPTPILVLILESGSNPLVMMRLMCL